MDNAIITTVQEHTEILKDHEIRLRNSEIKESVIETKLNTTNKILFAIFGTIFSATVALLFQAFSK